MTKIARLSLVILLVSLCGLAAAQQLPIPSISLGVGVGSGVGAGVGTAAGALIGSCPALPPSAALTSAAIFLRSAAFLWGAMTMIS